MFSLRFPRYREPSFRYVDTILRIGIAGGKHVARLFFYSSRWWKPDFGSQLVRDGR